MSLINKVWKDRVHEGLESGGGIAEAKGHNKRFKEFKGAFEGSFPFIAFLNADVIVTPTDIKLCKISWALKFVD